MTITPVQIYTDEDKKDRFPPGPWQDEHDKVVWVDEKTGLDCMVRRNHFGVWCGYVGVGPDHPLHKEPYQKWDQPGYWSDDVEVHGGLTFADSCQEGNEATGICHIPQEGRPHDVWWFGFDCGHAFDLSPGMLKYDLPPFDYEVYRTEEYAISETSRLAKQIAALSS